MVVGTVISLAAVVALLAFVVYRFWVTGQLSSRYWELFSWRTTWVYLGRGLAGTFQVALTAGVISLVLGMLLMLGRISHVKAPLGTVCRHPHQLLPRRPEPAVHLWLLLRWCPSLGFKMDFLLDAHHSQSRLPPPASSPRSSAPASTPCRSGQTEAAPVHRHSRRWKRQDSRSSCRRPSASSSRRCISQLVVVVKDTALAYVVTFPDLMQNAQVLRTNYDALVSVYVTIVVAVIYILINYAHQQGLRVRLAPHGRQDHPLAHPLG